MKKSNLIFLVLLSCISVFVSAQDINKPLKEDFFYTWVTEGVSGKTKYSFELTFLNESSYTNIYTVSRRKTILNYTILSWEEAVNTYTDTDEYPYGFKIISRDTKNNADSIFAIFINADKTKFLSVTSLGFYTEYYIYTKK